MFFGTEYGVRSLKGLNIPGIELGDGVFVPFGCYIGQLMGMEITHKPSYKKSQKRNVSLVGY